MKPIAWIGIALAGALMLCIVPSCFLSSSLDRKPGQIDVASAASKLNRKMLQEEVQKLLGKPDRSFASPVGPDQTWIYFDREQLKDLELSFREGFLSSIAITSDVSQNTVADVRATLRKIQPGMSMAEVERTIGKPSRTREWPGSDSVVWKYPHDKWMSELSLWVRFRQGVVEKTGIDD